uniref:Uncharacterized protein n=1 Tax=Pararge aegeria TaxID=116150 RepID=S4NXY4_9NEOP
MGLEPRFTATIYFTYNQSVYKVQTSNRYVANFIINVLAHLHYVRTANIITLSLFVPQLYNQLTTIYMRVIKLIIYSR